MRKTHIVGLMLFVVCAFSALATSPAFAGEWLFNGGVIATALAIDTSGELKLLPELGGTLLNDIDCSGVFEGTVGPGAAGSVTDLLNLAGTLIGELAGTALTCETLSNPTGMACTVGGETLVWVDELSLALGLTWTTEIELMAAAPIFLLHFIKVAFEQLCIIGGANAEFLCEGLTSGSLENVGNNVLLELSDVAPVSSEKLTCPTSPIAGVQVGLDGDITILHVNNGTLAVS